MPMKQLAVLFCAILLTLSLTACGGKENPQSGVPSSSVPEPPASGQEPEPIPLPELQPGKILPLGDERLNWAGPVGSGGLATQAELDRWNELISTAPVVRLDFNDMDLEEKDLPVEQEQEILSALRRAELRLYPPDYKENPFTGGGCTVIAYDGEKTVLFHVIFIGNWFTVQFGSEKVSYIFDGEGTALDDLHHVGYIAEPEQAPAPADNWERMLTTYYCPTDKLASRTVTDPRGLLPEGGSIDPAGLIETYSTGTSGKEECLALMDRLKAGEKLRNLLQNRGELYAIVTDPAGNEVGDALVKADSLEVMAYGAFPEDRDVVPFRRDCVLTGELKTRLEESGLDLSQTDLTFCIINGFSNGALFSDGTMEFFVPTAESSENMGVMEVGMLYPVTMVPGLVDKALPDMYPRFLLGGSCDIPLGNNEWGPAKDLGDYLTSRLTEDQYSGIIRMGSFLCVMVPSIAPVEALLPDYPGRMPPIDYQVVPYSKAQLTKAAEDVQTFLTDHPEVKCYRVSRNYKDVSIALEEGSPILDGFIADYPLKNAYRIIIAPDGMDGNPD